MTPRHRIAALEERIATLERLLFTHEHQAVSNSLFGGSLTPHWLNPDTGERYQMVMVPTTSEEDPA